MKPLYTIGYANYDLEGFIHALKKRTVDAVADVRSQPFSRYKPEFNRSALRDSLKSAGIKYVFLGDLLGARISDNLLYENDRVVFERVSNSAPFLQGLKRIRKGLEDFSIALMCAEADPLICHRDILVCRALRSEVAEIFHFIDPDMVETNANSELRLLKIDNLDGNDLFAERDELIEEAYRRQGRKIAYTRKADEVPDE